MVNSFTTPCGFFIVIGKHDKAIKITSYWQDKPVDLNRLELSLQGAKLLADNINAILGEQNECSNT